MKQGKPDIEFIHREFDEGESFSVEAADRNYIVFITKGRSDVIFPSDTSEEDIHYNSGDIAFFPVSFDFCIKFRIRGEVLAVAFDSTLEVFREMGKLLMADDESDISEFNGHLKVKYPLNMYILLVQRYMADGMMSPDLAISKLSELFMIFRKYYDEADIRSLFLPIVSAAPDFRLLVYTRMKLIYNVEELAQACRMGRRTFEKKFKEAFNGETPYSWLQRQKRKKILKKASLSGMTISDIIQEFNFYDASHFYKFCRQHYGKSPEELLK